MRRFELPLFLPNVIGRNYICLHANDCIKREGIKNIFACHTQRPHKHENRTVAVLRCDSPYFSRKYPFLIDVGWINGCYVFPVKE